MTSATQTLGLIPWNTLQTSLGGQFEARAHGLFRVSHTLIDRSGQPFGELRTQGARVTLTTGDLEAGIERTSRNGYRMLTGEIELARAAPLADSAATLRIECAGQVYEAHLRLLRSTAVVRALDGGEIVRLSGGLTGRRYEAAFDPRLEGALPVAILVLHYLTALRRRIYLAG